MWIKGWAADSFGHLHEAQLDGLTDGVNVVVGPNESGKTTMLHFLRWVLFGFPHHKTLAVKHYRPDTGDFGGRVDVVHDRQVISVQRHYGDDLPALSTADGSPLPPGIWRDVVGGAGRELFETVFAITTDELDGFSTLSTDEVREHIYAAGMVGSGPSAREALATLDDTRSALLKPRSGRIRELHRDLKERTEALHLATAVSGGLPDRRASLVGLRAHVDECDLRRRQLDTHAAHLADLIASWPAWSEATELRSELAAMPEAVDLPTDPLGRLDSLTVAVDAATRELEVAEQALASNAEQIRAIATDDRLPPLAAPARVLDRKAAIVSKLEADLVGLRSTQRHQATLLTEALRDLGDDWTLERTAAVDLSLPGLQRAREFAETTRSNQRRIEQTLSELQRAQLAQVDQARWEALKRDMRSEEPGSAVPGFAVPTLAGVAVLCLLAAASSIITGAPLPAIGFVSVACVAGWLSLILHRHRTPTPPLPGDPQGPSEPVPEHAQAASGDHHDALAAQESLAREWDTWCSQAGLPRMRPEDCAEFLNRVRQARTAAESHAATTRSITDATDEIDRHRLAVAELLSQAGMDPGAPDASLPLLLDEVRRDAANRRAIDELRRTRPVLQAARDSASTAVKQAGATLDALLVHAGVHDAEGFRVVAAREASRHRITGRLTQIDIELSGRFGNDEAVEAARAELAGGDLQTWKHGVAALDEHQAEALITYESAFESYRSEAAAIEAQEHSADVAGLSLEVEALRSELREAMDDWTVATLAHKAIDDTLRRFETERQPGVVLAAADSFRRITAGRYTNLVPGEESLQVVEPGGRRLDSSQLSRGTAEQLYLAMRLALARQHAHRSALPLVLDDVLVNADPQRRLRLAEELHEVAEDLQVMLFTCHPGTAELLADLPTRNGTPRRTNIVEMPT